MASPLLLSFPVWPPVGTGKWSRKLIKIQDMMTENTILKPASQKVLRHMIRNP
jgi:hypothetical protein